GEVAECRNQASIAVDYDVVPAGAVLQNPHGRSIGLRPPLAAPTNVEYLFGGEHAAARCGCTGHTLGAVCRRSANTGTVTCFCGASTESIEYLAATSYKPDGDADGSDGVLCAVERRLRALLDAAVLEVMPCGVQIGRRAVSRVECLDRRIQEPVLLLPIFEVIHP